MKQQVLCCLLLTIGAGTCRSYGGSFSKSYSSSSASASSSAFSSSFSSGADSDLKDISNSLKAGAQATSAAFAHAGANGAKAGSGAFAGASSGAFAGSKSFSGSGLQAGSGEQLGSGIHSGSYSKSGSLSSTGSTCASCSGSKTGLNIDKEAGSKTNQEGLGAFAGEGSESYSGTKSISGSGLQVGPSVQLGSGSHSGNSGSYSKPGSVSSTETSGSVGSVFSSGLNTQVNYGIKTSTGESLSNGGSTVGVTGQNSVSIGHEQLQGSNPLQKDTKLETVDSKGSGSGSTGGGSFINDFQIPIEYQNPETKPTLNKILTGSGSHSYNSGSSQGSIDKSKPCCQGPFPGPKGSIHDFKPAPPGGGGPPAWTPEEQKPVVVVPTQPSSINTDYHQGTTGLSSQLIHSFPGSQGGIHDSKPVYNKPSYNGGNIPVSVIPVIPQIHQQPVSGGSTVIATLPGSTGSIYTNIPVGQNPVQPSTNYDNKKPVPSADIIHSFPGKPGNIHDNKIVPTSPCTGGHCQTYQNTNVGATSVNSVSSVSGNYNPKTPDCSTGQCDEYGGKLGCHGDGCFGPGKKPSNAHFAAGTSAKSNTQQGSGSFNVDLSGTYEHELCKSGKCHGKPTDIPQSINVQQPEYITVDVVPINVPSVSEQNVYPAPGSINFGENQPVPTYQGTLCSGVECLLPPTGTKQIPSGSNSGCSGAYCINIIPEPQAVPSCSGGNCGNKVPTCVGGSCSNDNQPKNVYQHTGSKSNSNVQTSQGQEKVAEEQPVEVEIPVPTKEVPTSTNKPYDKGSSSSQDFLLPGNKPHHHHNIKPLQPAPPKTQPEKTPGGGYYTCTGTSCPLPKHPGQITSYQTVPINEPSKPDHQSCSGNDCTPHLKPFNIPDEYKGAGVHDRIYPEKTKPFKIPDEYKGGSNNDQKVQPLPAIPVVIGGEPQVSGNKPTNHYSGNIADSGAKSGSNGFVSGTVIVEKPDGIMVPVVDVHIPGYSCSGGQCDGPKQTTDDGFASGIDSGSYTGSSGQNLQENVGGTSGSYSGSTSENKQGNFQGSGCSTGKCGTDLSGGSYSGSGSYGGKTDSGSAGTSLQGNGCTTGKCGLNGGTSGSYSGSTSDNLQGNFQGSGCSTGKCGTGSNGGSGSYGGSSSETYIQEKVHGNGCSGGLCKIPIRGDSAIGCTSGKCGSNGGSYGGSTSGNLQGHYQGSGCSTGKCGTDITGGSYSGSGSYGGVKGGCKGGTCGSPVNNGGYSGAFASSSSFSGSGSGAYSGSGANTYTHGGFEGFPLLKELIHQTIKGEDVHSGAGSFSGASSYSGGGAASAHSAAYSSAGSYLGK